MRATSTTQVDVTPSVRGTRTRRHLVGDPDTLVHDRLAFPRDGARRHGLHEGH